MVKKLAIDWDDGELRLVAAQCSGRNVKVTDAAVIPIADGNVEATLRSAISSRGLAETPTLVAIGRGRAELRELQLPPVPDDELPDMVRFQAIRSFASAGENATVDYLVTNRKSDGVEMIAAAVTPANLGEIKTLGERAGVPLERVSLRPLSAAALYLLRHGCSDKQDTVLIDLLSDDAEIVVAREGRVIFVRTVRMPTTVAGRGRALAGELKRSLVACGSSGSLDRVVLWGKESVHVEDVKMLAEASGANVQAVDPFTLVDVESSLKENLPDHVGRLAPLVGMLAADENNGDLLIDFLNPRKKVEEVPNPYRKALLYGVPAAAAVLLAGAVYFQLRGLDQKIAELKSENGAMKSDVDSAGKSVQRTETIDAYLDGDVNWLDEMRRLATTVPPAEQLIVKQISGTTDARNGGGTLRVEGAVTQPSAIDAFEDSMRDESHRVTGDGASEQPNAKVYRWGFVESVTVTPASIRNTRYQAIADLLASESAEASPTEDTEASPTEDEASTTEDESADSASDDSDPSDAEPAEDDMKDEAAEDAESPSDADPSSDSAPSADAESPGEAENTDESEADEAAADRAAPAAASEATDATDSNESKLETSAPVLEDKGPEDSGSEVNGSGDNGSGDNGSGENGSGENGSGEKASSNEADDDADVAENVGEEVQS